jgi:hypothetical protein
LWGTKRCLWEYAKKEQKVVMNGSKWVLLLGVLSLLIPIIGVFLGMLAIGLGIKSKVQAKGNGYIQVKIGMILGITSVVLTIVGLVFFLPLFIVI